MEFELEIRRFLDHAKIVQQLSDSIGTAEDCKEARLELDRAREKTKEEDIALSTKFKEYTRDVNLRGDANFKRLEPLYQSWAERWRLIYKESFVREAKHPLKSTASSKAPSLSSPIPAKPDRSHQAPSSRSFSPPKPNEGPSERKITSLETKKYSSKDEIMREIVQERNREISTLKDDLVEVADVFKVTANLVRQHGTTLDAIETHLDEVQTETRKSMNVIAEAARENANMSAWPISGAAIGGIVLGGIGSFMGPVGLIAGGTAGATLGRYMGNSVGQLQLDVVDKEIFERQLKDKWARDEDVYDCGLCRKAFTAFLRKHHCRSCGQVFCADCSSKRLEFKLENMDKPRMERACDTCYDKFWRQ